MTSLWLKSSSYFSEDLKRPALHHLYELAKHPEIQSKLRKEICEVLQKNDNEVTYETIQEMKFLDMVVSGEFQ